MTRKTALAKQTSTQGALSTKEVEAEIETLLKAAATMPDDEAKEHVSTQVGRIWDKLQIVSLDALKQRLAALQVHKDTTTEDLNKKRGERKKQSRFISDNKPNEEENNDE